MSALKYLLPFFTVLLLTEKSAQAQLLADVQTSEEIFIQQDEPEEEQLDSLKILSWNIYMLPVAVKFTGKRKRAKALGEYFEKSDYDVLVLQEAFHHGARRQILKRIKDKFNYRVGPAFRRFVDIRTSSGIWILSKLPMKEVAKVKYKSKWGFDNKMARKGAVMVEVEKNGQAFQIIGTHLNAGGPLDVRASQLRQIRDKLIRPFRNEEKPLVIAGDMNINKNDKAAYDSLISILDVEPYELTGDFPYTYDYTMNDLAAAQGQSQSVIDYAFVSNKTRFPVIKKIFRFIPLIEKRWTEKHKSLADHNPIEINIQFVKKKKKP